ncbi:hypothetical protein GOC38_14715 [Sinorhizobium meliloti]|nr:hypothetical protein [Sinorhizobium meliloti]MDX0325509.1 hypothetical protein [Sinorhizobium meliloti]
MTAKIARLRPIPTIAFEPEEGMRLRRQSAETGREQVQGADDSRPHRPWSQDAYDLQMKAKVAVTLIGELFSNLKAMEDLLEFKLRENSGLDELAFQIHEIQKATERLQPA